MRALAELRRNLAEIESDVSEKLMTAARLRAEIAERDRHAEAPRSEVWTSKSPPPGRTPRAFNADVRALIAQGVPGIEKHGSVYVVPRAAFAVRPRSLCAPSTVANDTTERWSPKAALARAGYAPCARPTSRT